MQRRRAGAETYRIFRTRAGREGFFKFGNPGTCGQPVGAQSIDHGLNIFRNHLPIIFGFFALSHQGFAVNVLTYHNDNAHTGLNSEETALTLQNVNPNSFGLIRNLPVDGAVFAQTLYVSSEQIITGGLSQGFHNLVIVATQHDSVYAFDADSGVLYWQASMLGAGEVPADGLGCEDLPGENGITSTPVIDRSAGIVSSDIFAMWRARRH